MHQKTLNQHKRVTEEETARSLVTWRMQVKRREVVEAEVEILTVRVKKMVRKNAVGAVAGAEMQKTVMVNHVEVAVNIVKMEKKVISLAVVEVSIEGKEMKRAINPNGVEVNTEVKEKKTNQDAVAAKPDQKEKRENQKVAPGVNQEVAMT